MNCLFDPYIEAIHTNDDVGVRIEEEALLVALRTGTVSADDLHGVDLGGRDGRIIGAVLAKLAKRGQLRRGELVLSRRRECHHRPIRIFHAPKAAAPARTADHGGAEFLNTQAHRQPDEKREVVR